jgi:hypothetical protein
MLRTGGRLQFPSLRSSSPRGQAGLVGLRKAPLALRASLNWSVCPSTIAIPTAAPVPLGPDGLPPHAGAMRMTKPMTATTTNRIGTSHPLKIGCRWEIGVETSGTLSRAQSGPTCRVNLSESLSGLETTLLSRRRPDLRRVSKPWCVSTLPRNGPYTNARLEDPSSRWCRRRQYPIYPAPQSRS